MKMLQHLRNTFPQLSIETQRIPFRGIQFKGVDLSLSCIDLITILLVNLTKHKSLIRSDH